MSMCQAWDAGHFSLITWRADTLSMKKCIGLGQRASAAMRMQLRCFAVFPQVTDEQNPASVKLVTTTAWMQLFHATTAKWKSATSPVMKWWVLRLVARAALMQQINSSWKMRGKGGGLTSPSKNGKGTSGRPSKGKGQQNMTSHDLVHQRHLQMPFSASKCSLHRD